MIIIDKLTVHFIPDDKFEDNLHFCAVNNDSRISQNYNYGNFLRNMKNVRFPMLQHIQR